MYNNAKRLQSTNVFVDVLIVAADSSKFSQNNCIETVIGEDILKANKKIAIASLHKATSLFRRGKTTEAFVNKLCNRPGPFYERQQTSNFSVIQLGKFCHISIAK